MTPISRTVLRALALLALFATPAAAQMPSINMMPDVKTKSPEEKEREAQVDKAYRESLKKIPDSKGAADPWGDVRGAEVKKPAAQPRSGAPKRVAN